MEDRVPVNGKPYGTISWEEHLEATKPYHDRFGNSQTAERIAERGGYGWNELIDFLGHEPKSWQPEEGSDGTQRASGDSPPGAT